MNREVQVVNNGSSQGLSHPPGTWPPFRKKFQKLLAPVERFLAIEAASGIVLIAASAAALIWANSPWRASYAALWHLPVGLQFANIVFQRDLHFWINDGLMTIFFFVVGLEIRREIHCGELSEIRRAVLPLAAAVGGMLVPALIFIVFNAGRASFRGWAVPMATDIAFAVGVLALLGKRVSPAIRILLLALAIIDDVGAILVIALFYSSNISAIGFVVLAAGLLATLLFQLLGVRSPLAYVLPSIVIWAGAYAAGIHPTLAGVIIGFMTPVRAWYGPTEFLNQTEDRVKNLRSEGVPSDERALLHHLDTLQVANREAVAPVERLQHALHGWVAFAIMPLFAFANAGVSFGQIDLAGDALWVLLGVSIGLITGKPIGIATFSWIAARTGMAALPRGVHWPHIAVVGALGGIGFTMALFIAQLAFAGGPLLETAKLAILVSSATAGMLSLVLGRKLLRADDPGMAKTEVEAESSTVS